MHTTSKALVNPLTSPGGETRFLNVVTAPERVVAATIGVRDTLKALFTSGSSGSPTSSTSSGR